MNARIEPDDDDDCTEACPACGEPIDYCQGHGEIGDPIGRAILERHDDGDHSLCHPAGCDAAPLSGIVAKGMGRP
jgi:hypothetical protein